MSWSVSYAGPIKSARKAVKASFKGCLKYLKADPTLAEEAILCELARKLVVRHLKTHPVALDVSVVAHGHQGKNEAGTYQNFSVSVGPVSKPQS